MPSQHHKQQGLRQLLQARCHRRNLAPGLSWWVFELPTGRENWLWVLVCNIRLGVSDTLLQVSSPSPHFGYPWLPALILTHILQTEVKSKMNALKKGLQREPA